MARGALKYWTIDEIKALKDSEGYYHFGLFEYRGNVVINYNAIKNDSETRLNAIIDRLQSDLLPDGVYTIRAKFSASPKSRPDNFYFKKGEINENEALSEKPVNSENMDKNILQLNIDLARATVKVEHLEKEIKYLQDDIRNKDAYIDELESQVSELPDPNLSEPAGAAAQTGKIVEAIGTAAVPIIEGIFKAQDQKFALQMEQLRIYKEAMAREAAKATAAEKLRYQTQPGNGQGFADQQEQENNAANNQGYNEADFLYNKIQELAKTDPDKAAYIMEAIINPQTLDTDE